MKNKNSKKIFFFIILLAFFAFAGRVSAANIKLVSGVKTIGLGGQFYIDLLLDPGGVPLNAIEGTVTYPIDQVALLRTEKGGSMISLWIKEPLLESDRISFAGIMPNGFSGVIDPFNPSDKLPGQILRLVFQSKFSGPAVFKTDSFLVAQNDGEGTTENIPNSELALTIRAEKSSEVYQGQKGESPTLEAYVIRDVNLFNNKYALIFQAKDNGSGIKDVMIKEGDRAWKSIRSPYLLLDQTRSRPVSLYAVNYSGESIVLSINPTPHKFFNLSNPILYLLAILVFVFVAKKIYEKRRREKNNI